MKTVAVTGAGGMIGRHLVEALKPAASEVRVLLMPAETAPACFGGTHVFRGDIQKQADLRPFLDGADTVFHLAALVGKDANAYAEARAVNVEGTRNLIEVAKETGVAKFVLLSTCCVYGLHGLRNEVVDERTPHAPFDHPYDQTKTEAEELLTAEDPKHLPWSVLQVPVVLGGVHIGTKPNLMAHIKLTRRGIIPHAMGNGSWANYVYAGDVAQALVCLGTHPKSSGECFLYNEAVPMNELFEWIAKDLEVRVRRIPAPGFALRLASRINSRMLILANRRRFSSDKLRSRLGFSPKVGLREGLRLTIAQYQKSGLIG